MAFVRKKRVNGYEYYQLVESYRENGKVRQRTLAHLGEYPTVEAAIEAFKRCIEHFREMAYRNRTIAREMHRINQLHFPRYLGHPAIVIPRPVRGDSNKYKDPHTAFHRSYWRMIDKANDAERQATVYKEKLEKLQLLMDSGKAKPEPTEMGVAKCVCGCRRMGRAGTSNRWWDSRCGCGHSARRCGCAPPDFAELLARVGAPLVPVGQPVRPMVHGATPAADLPRRAAGLVAA